MKWALLLACASLALAGEGPQLIFTRSFPGSTPAYIQLNVQKTGDAEYREAADDELPLKFKLPATDVQQLFELSAKLDYFTHPLESPVKVAFMGTKTFRYEDGGKKSEVQFNYSQDLTAQALLDWFERMAETEGLRINLERAAKYDHLGVMKALLQLDSAMFRNRAVAPEQFLPMLDRVSKNETYMHAARARAAEMAEAIRNPKK